MKKICMIVPSFEAKGGITSVVRGYRGSDLEKRYQIRYIETYCDGVKVKKLAKAIRAYALFLWTLIVFKPDLIHIHSSFGASFYRKAPFICIASLLQIPVVNHIHGSELDRFYRKKPEYHQSFIRTVFKKCSRILVLSEQWREQFTELIDLNQMDVVANYSICPKKKFENRNKQDPSVLFLGFLSELKGCFDIPKVAESVAKEIKDVHFVLAGSGTAGDLQQIQALAKEQGVEKQLVFPGWANGKEKDGLLQQASVFFLPSYTEGMPMSILEAMGYGLPVVSTTVGGIPELVEHGKSGFLLEPGDTEGFAEAIITLLKDSRKRMEMGQAGLSHVQENYSLEKHIGSLMNVYDSLIR